ncbi:hypothetical protein HPB52_008040 [Rhipicephalus sanguineus]|uniref:CCHC-type domain-containing protein n=1 Tax=Rhipicephalus sanguineus TaxID=34632 RepID=A0A9D4PGK2_RHISA|nr:hypothetical protein HPB52_008040 [Rhipicephalus sanguineus]
MLRLLRCQSPSSILERNASTVVRALKTRRPGTHPKTYRNLDEIIRFQGFPDTKFCQVGPFLGRLLAPFLPPRRHERQVQRLCARRHRPAAAAVGPESLTCRRTSLELPIPDGNVEGEDIRPEDFGEGAGWCRVKRTKQGDGASESAQDQQAETQQQAAAAEAAREDSICLNVKQNVVVLSTPSADRAKRYGAISKLCIGNREFEANAYQAAPENTYKGLIRNISKDESPEDIVNNLVTQRNPSVLHAKRMGTTDKIIVLFDGFHVPRHVYYGPMLVRCSLYRKHIDVCFACGRLGHRSDVCPNPADKICRGCGSSNPPSDHRCEPRCQLCGKDHLTGDRVCKARYKTPYIVKCRRLERKRREEEQAAAASDSIHNSGISTEGNGGHYNHNPALDSYSSDANRRGRSSSRDAKGGGTGHRDREACPRRAVAPFRAPQLSTKAPNKVSSISRGGSRNNKDPSARGSRAENSKLKGEAPRVQQPQQQAATPPPPTPRSSTPSRPEAAGVDRDDESSLVEGAGGREDRPCLFVLNVYSKPSLQHRFGDLLRRASTAANGAPLLVAGDFNAPHGAWGYTRETLKAKHLWEDSQDQRLELIANPADPTRGGNSVSADTLPDLAFVSNVTAVSWQNTQEDVGSDHSLIEITVDTGASVRGTYSEGTGRRLKLVQWDAFRKKRAEGGRGDEPIADIDEWTATLNRDVDAVTCHIPPEAKLEVIDSRLLHMWEAKQALLKRWKRQRHNRALRKRIAQLDREIQEHAFQVCSAQWEDLCNGLERQMRGASAWYLLRHLLDPEDTRAAQSHQTRRLVTDHKGDDLLGAIRDRYFNTYADDVTLWVPGGCCDGHVERTLQAGVDEVQEYLRVTGLECSATKWELLIYKPTSRGRKTPRDEEREQTAIMVRRYRSGIFLR